MSKNKKGKVVSLKPAQLSPEKYIKTQARSLPVAECLVTGEWQNTGVCSVVVARKHVTGNLTVGLYLVDLYCLGLKDTTYEFNISPEEFGKFKHDDFLMEKCSYVTAHNIIYGAIAFAEDYGFKPDKDFAVTQFILEEDDERVELLDIEFGVDGMPCFIPGPDDDEAKIKRITATLERTAGPGNFEIMDAPDEGEEFDDDDIYDEEFYDEDFYDEDLKEFQEDLQQAQEELQQDYERFPGLLKKINKAYDELVRTADAKEILEKSAIGNAYKVFKGKVQNEYTLFDDALQEEEYNRLKVMLMEGEDPELVEKKIKKAILKYPHKPAFYDMLIPVYHFSKQYDKQNELVLETYKLFPDVLIPKIGYSTLLLDGGRAEEALEVFNGKTDLNYLYPERKTFYISEAADYYACMCRTFTALGDIDSADLYMDAIFKKKLTAMPGNTLVTTAIKELINAKMKKIEELNIH